MAETLHGQGHSVEVFTTCTRAANDWTNEMPAGRDTLNGIPVSRFRIDRHDRLRHREGVRAILEADGRVAPEVESEYLEHSIHSRDLIAALEERRDEFDAVIVGPYLFGLTLDVARAVPDKTLLLPCFHDEPLARLKAWPVEYERIGGILYHSPEEQAFAEAHLGINHPNAACIDGLVETAAHGDPEAGHEHARSAERYVVYCGRYSAQKGLPALLEYCQRYLERHPERFSFVFLGQGEVAIPEKPGFVDLGFVAEDAKRDVLAGASALALLSRYESLSYAALEAWAQGTPVIADQSCAVLAGHLRRCGGGRAVATFDDFSLALDDLFARPEAWQEFGVQGQEYVRKRYGSRSELGQKIEKVIRDLRVPIAELMRGRGLERASILERSRWREQFGDLVEQVLDAGPRPYTAFVEVKPRVARRAVSSQAGTVLVAVRVVNRGSHALLAEGAGRTVLRCWIWDEAGNLLASKESVAPLPGLLIPGRAMAAVVPVKVPAMSGEYRVAFEAVSSHRVRELEPSAGDQGPPGMREHSFTLIVEEGCVESADSCCGPLLESAQAALVEASRRQRLPDDYRDVTEGVFAAWKRRIKRKLLGNFKHAYVDVLSRQQSAFNQFIIAAIHELSECCATLDHTRQLAAPAPHMPPLGDDSQDGRDERAALAERVAQLEARLGELEARAPS
jgi:glycosyltransferase involved in cell wall biosynthesis